MIVDQFKIKVNDLRSTLNTQQQKMLSLNSIENFLLYFDNLELHKEKVFNLLVSYFEEIKEYDYLVDNNVSNRLAFDYIMKIGTFYKKELGFKVQMNLQFALMVGIHVDAVLLIFGILKMLYYLPIITLILFCRWLYLKRYFEKKHKVHNIRF